MNEYEPCAKEWCEELTESEYEAYKRRYGAMYQAVGGMPSLEEMNARRRELGVKYARVREKYGQWLSESDIQKVLAVEEEEAYCAKCDGSRCLRHEAKVANLAEGLTTSDAAYWRLYAEVDRSGNQLSIRQMVGRCVYAAQHQRRKEAEKFLKDSGIPRRYEGRTWREYEVDEQNCQAVEAAEAMLEQGGGLYMYGLPGGGKTFLAALIAKEWASRGESTIFIKVPRLLNSMRQAMFDTSKGSERQLQETLSEASLLVLDDFGMEKSTTFAGSVLCNLIDERYDAEKSLIVTSNLTLEELERHLNNPSDGVQTSQGSRIVDRIREMCKEVHLGGLSRRRRA